MKYFALLSLLVAASLFAAAETVSPPMRHSSVTEQARLPVVKVYSVSESNTAYRAYAVRWQGHEVIASDPFGTTNYREGDEIVVSVARTTMPGRPDVLMFLAFPDPRATVPGVPRPPVAKVTMSVMRFFECRGGEVFFVDVTGLQALVARVKQSVPAGDAAGLHKALAVTPVANEHYAVDPSLIATGMLRLQPRPGVRGERVEDLERADSQFQKVLQQLNKSDAVVLMVRDDSVAVAEKAKQIAERAGLCVSLQPMKGDQPLQFGAGGSP